MKTFSLQLLAALVTICSAQAATVAREAQKAEGGPSCNAEDLLLDWPLDGDNGRDWVVTNFVDLDNREVLLLDYEGATGDLARTYDGHRGLDIRIPTYRGTDLSTAVVRAAAPGEVLSVHDSEPDRNKIWCKDLLPGEVVPTANEVKILHDNGFVTRYLHLKRGSITVGVGDRVSAGDVLAIVASSGCSTGPHLHLQVEDCDGDAVEPFQEGMWRHEPAYEGDRDVMDVVLSCGQSFLGERLDNAPPDVRTLPPGGTLGVGIVMSGSAGDTLDLALVNPSGSEHTRRTAEVSSQRYGRQTFGWSIPLSEDAGEWTLELSVNGSLRDTRQVDIGRIRGSYWHGVRAHHQQAVFENAVCAGLRPVWLDGFETNDELFFNPLYAPAAGGPAWASIRSYDGAGYQKQFDALVDLGYRLVYLDSYVFNSKILYSAIFEKRLGPLWQAYHGQPLAEHQERFDTLTGQGYSPINISAASLDGELYYAALYEKRDVGSFFSSSVIPLSEYQEVFDENSAAGRQLAYLNGFDHLGQPHLSAIWHEAGPLDRVSQHGLSGSEYQSVTDDLVDAGYGVRIVTGYETALGARFAAKWSR